MESCQAFEPAFGAPPFTADAPAAMPDGTVLRPPIRDHGAIGVAGLILDQAAFPVLRRLAGWAAAAGLGAEEVVGLPRQLRWHAPARAAAQATPHGRAVAQIWAQHPRPRIAWNQQDRENPHDRGRTHAAGGGG